MQPEKKLVLVTGAGSGIGRELCIDAARRGMAVALCGRRQDALEETSALLEPGTPHFIVPADITRPEDRRQIVDRIGNERGALDILINNAGLVEGGPLETFDDNALARMFQTNIVAPMALTRDLLPLLTAAKPSRVVNVGSSIALRREWKRKGISVTYAAPRATRTDAAVAFAGLIAKTKMNMDPPEQVARQIWRAIAGGHDSVYAPAPERIYVLIQRLFPSIIDRSLS
jgi:short-subunit dehydrogenase